MRICVIIDGYMQIDLKKILLIYIIIKEEWDYI